ncbi:MAG: dienelactone hydrolase family protein [Proteobacteria bacterium]|nr:dienelactone hydrolase family protein [Pseudomonadota bacterium]
MIKSEAIIYEDPRSGDKFEGAISWDNDKPGQRPGVLVAHAFGGQSQFDIDKSIELAKLGYVAFAIDMYGKGRRGSSPEESRELMNELNSDRPELLKRIQLALEVLKEHPFVNTAKLGAIGFCFGGKCVLDLARSGAEVCGVVSFHGLLDKPEIEISKPIVSAVLVLHGWDDPMATPEQTIGLTKEKTKNNADWQLLAFGNTGHAFTNPKADAYEDGLFYKESADNRSWIAMTGFFTEVFK